MTTKEAKKYLAGHMGYIKYANVNNLVNKLFYKETQILINSIKYGDKSKG